MTWNVDSSTLTTIVLIAVSVGFFAGLLVSLLRRNKPLKPPRNDLVELGHLWRDQGEGRLWLQLDEQSGTSLEGFEGEEKDRARQVAGEFAAWVARPMKPASSSLLRAAQQTDPAPQPASPEPPLTAPGESSLADKPPASDGPYLPADKAASSGSTEKPRIDIVKGIRLTMEGSMNKPSAEPSIAAQVDAILQEKLKGTQLESRGVRLMELPGKGMVVMIGLDQYDTVEDVPFPEIKALLKSAVAEWERKMLG